MIASRRAWALLVAAATGAFTVPREGTAAHRWAATQAPADGRVAVDAREVPTMPTRKVDDVAEKATRAVVDAGLSPAAVRIAFVEVDPVAVQRGVRVRLDTAEVAIVDPEGDPRGRLLATCTACSDAELAGLAIEAVLEAIDLHQEAVQAQRTAAERAAAEQTAAAAELPPPADASPPPSAEPRRRLGPLGWSGIAALGLGTGAVITGAVLASRTPAPFPGERRMDELRDVRPPGYAVLGVGAVLLVGGAVLVAVDRRRARSGRLTAAPWLGPGAVGLAVARPF